MCPVQWLFIVRWMRGILVTVGVSYWFSNFSFWGYRCFHYLLRPITWYFKTNSFTPHNALFLSIVLVTTILFYPATSTSFFDSFARKPSLDGSYMQLITPRRDAPMGWKNRSSWRGKEGFLNAVRLNKKEHEKIRRKQKRKTKKLKRFTTPKECI